MAPQQDQRGFTLVELLVGMVVSIVVLLATFALLDSATGSIGRDEARAQAAEDPLAGAARMVRELRGAEDVVEMTANAMDVIVSTGGVLKRVRYDCDVAAPNDPGNPYDDLYRRCVRRAATAVPDADPPALPPLSDGQVVVDRICPGTAPTTCASAASAPVFTCHADDGSVVACGELPQPPVDPDDLPEAGDEPPAPLWPATVDVRIDVPARGPSSRARYSHRISFTDGIFFRNIERTTDTTG